MITIRVRLSYIVIALIVLIVVAIAFQIMRHRGHSTAIAIRTANDIGMKLFAWRLPFVILEDPVNGHPSSVMLVTVGSPVRYENCTFSASTGALRQASLVFGEHLSYRIVYSQPDNRIVETSVTHDGFGLTDFNADGVDDVLTTWTTCPPSVAIKVGSEWVNTTPHNSDSKFRKTILNGQVMEFDLPRGRWVESPYAEGLVK